MRIGVNALYLIPSQVGGSETYLVELLEAIAAGHPQVQLVLFTNYENDALFKERFGRYPQVRFCLLKFHARSRPMRILREQIELPVKAKQCKIDLLFSPGYRALYFDETGKEDLKAKVRRILSKSAEEKEDLLRKGRERAKDFSWEKAARKTPECFAETLKKAGELA